MAGATARDGGLVVAALPEDEGKLVCIEYPGFVDNVDRAISSLGGMKTIEKVYYDKVYVLEARLRPEDRFCKPVVGRPLPVTNMVLRVRRRRGKRNGEGGEGDVGGPGENTSGPDCQVEVLGMVRQTYQFKGMVDFQVLPPGLNQVPHKAETLDPSVFQISEPFNDEFLDSTSVPLFLPPWAFSKFDKPSNYASRPDFQPRVTGNLLPGSSRHRRQVFAIGIPFDHNGSVPSQPHPNLPEIPTTQQTKLEIVKKLFEERPVWSRSWIQCKTKLPGVIVRSLLAAVSYYFTSGPWKLLWVRLGYDPRSSPDSKPYQCLDYRIPREIAGVSTLESRRNKLRKVHAGNEKLQEVFQLSGDLGDSVQPAEAAAEASATETEASPVFTADHLPNQRHLYYQLCDLRSDSLQAVIHANDGREEICSEVNGWCEEGTYDQLRKMLGEMVRKIAERVEGERQVAQQQTAADSTRPS